MYAALWLWAVAVGLEASEGQLKLALPVHVCMIICPAGLWEDVLHGLMRTPLEYMYSYSLCIVTSITPTPPQKLILPHTTKAKQELLLHTVFEYMSKFTLSHKSDLSFKINKH